jgi:NAD(P)H-binding
MFVVTGITGNVGGEVARRLLAAHLPVRGIVRDVRKGAAWAARGCEICAADINDAAALSTAFKGEDGPGSPPLAEMDKLINKALGNGNVSHLLDPIPPINNEPFINALHALTHGNPISVRMLGFGLDKIFQTDMMLARAELELNWFRVLLYRRMLREEFADIWKLLKPIYNRPLEMRNAAIQAGEEIHKAVIAASPEAFQKAK